MEKHYRVAGMLHSYEPKNEEHIYEPTAVSHRSEIRYSQIRDHTKRVRDPR